MSGIQQLADKFSLFYNDIDTEINELRSNVYNKNHQMINALAIDNDCEVINILNAAKKVEQEAKSKVNPKVKRRNLLDCTKSSFPPIWNDKKLNNYVQCILNDLIMSSPEESSTIVKDEAITNDAYIKSGNLQKTAISNDYMEKTSIRIPKRNVGTNVHFLIQNTEKNNLVERNVLYGAEKKRVNNRKTQTCYPNDSKSGVNKVNEKSFPQQRIERVENNDEPLNANFKKQFKASKQKPNQPQKLKFSATTFTSTSGLEKSTENHGIIHIEDSNLVTNHSKQMSSIVLPVLSIEGKCSVQNIYQFEILTMTARTSKFYNEYYNSNRQNIKLIDIKHPNFHKNSSNEIPKVTPDVNENKNMLVNINDLKNALSYYNVNIDNGKLHVVIDKKKYCKRKKRKKRRDFNIAGHQVPKYFNKKKQKEVPFSKYENKQTQKGTISDSSSLSTDRKLGDILNFYGQKHRKVKGTLSFRYPATSSYDDQTNTSSNETNKCMTNDAKKANNLEYNNITESFQSMYKLIEDTFQSSLIRNAEETDVCENENNMSEMKEIIKMSEENIKRAEMLLKKYNRIQDKVNPFSKNENFDTRSSIAQRKIDVCIQADVNEMIEDRVNNGNSNLCQQSTRKNDDEIINDPSVQCQNYLLFSQGLKKKLQHSKINETANSGAQTTDDKALQTDRNFNWKSRHYFKTVYDSYSNVNFDESKFSSAKNLLKRSNINHIASSTVPYNPIYSNDDEIMKVANKFLRSIEKEKKISIESSEEDSCSEMLKQQITISSSSTSTPTNDLLLENDIFRMYSGPPKCFENDFDTLSEGEVLSIGEVRRVHSSISEVSLSNES